MKTTADATISVDQLTVKFKTWQLYTQLLEYIRQGKNRIRLVASCRWAFKCTCKLCGQILKYLIRLFVKILNGLASISWKDHLT